jgi:multidrug efflux system membrane fusion protein
MRYPRLFIVASSVLLLAACAEKQAPSPAPRAVIGQIVGAVPAATQNVYSGEVRARYENDLAFRVGGKVVARHVDVGARVEQGQVLARLDPQDALLNVDAARSALAGAEADHALAKAEVERYRDLFERKFVSRAVLDARETSFNTTKARLEQARAQARVAENQSAYTTLVAEADGVITAVQLEPGQVVSGGQTVMRFARPSEKEVVISVPESRLEELRRAQSVLVAVPAATGRPAVGRIREIAPNADPATRTFAVRISIADPAPSVQLGMTATVALAERGQPEVLRVPLTAVSAIEGRPAVWVVDPATNRVNPRVVEIGAYREDGVTVSGGLQRGEIIVTAGVHKLLAGETVRVLSDALAAPGAQRQLDAAVRNGG